MRLFALLALACTVLLLGPSRVARAQEPAVIEGESVAYRFDQKRYVYSRQAAGSLAYVPSNVEAGATVPVVVFFHGLNPDEKLHPELDGSAFDLRRLVDALVREGKVAPFVLAAPTHSRLATGTRAMWHDFDLDRFLTTTQAAIGARATLDRSRVVLVGHSGGGCNPDAGILAPNVAVHSILAVDTCLDTDVSQRLLSLAQRTDVRFYYQRGWRRPFDAFEDACRGAAHCGAQEIGDLGTNPHREILGEALRVALPKVLPAAAAKR
ncbi:MAG: alpha/beta fold hydrolase [Polyangiaceae bacterium]|nr:alpha/beta fold hydrolase [Polyangiaceae bacterium]